MRVFAKDVSGGLVSELGGKVCCGTEDHLGVLI